MIAVKIAVLSLVVAGLGLAIHIVRRWSGGSAGRRAEARSRWTRILCGAAGGAILVAFGVVTIRTAAREDLLISGPRNLQVPTLPPPADAASRKVASGRYLLHLAAVRPGQTDGPAIAAETVDLHWPSDRNHRFALHATIGNAVLDAELILGEILWKQEYSWGYEGSESVSVRTPHSHQSRSGGIVFPEVDDFGLVRGEKDFLSLRGIPGEDLEFVMDLTPVREDDPLRAGDVKDLIALRGADQWLKIRSRHADNGPLAEREFYVPHASPAEALAARLDFNVFPLLAAAILLAQLFRRRWPGFVQATAAILLYLGALDRVALRLTEAHVRDTNLTVDSRLRACRRMTSTAFFQETALTQLHAISRDESLPPVVRARAARLGMEK
jgi:hypothetical protein